MRVLFGQSYYLRFDAKLWESQQPYPPLGTLYAAAMLRETGHDVHLFDAMLAEGTEAWAQALDRAQPQVAVIYEDNFNYLSKMSLLRMREAASTMIQAARKRGCVVIVSGADMTDHPESYLSYGADYVILGEGEQTLLALIDLLRKGKPNARALQSTPGLAYLKGDTVQRTGSRPVMRYLDLLPRPAWDLIDMEAYRRIWRKHGRFSLNLVTTRGCPFHCNWCAKPIWGQQYHSHSPQYIVEQMQYLKTHYAPDHIWFMDDIMGIRDQWIEEFADLLDAQQAHIPFKCLNRADLLLRGQTIPALARAGAEIVWIGAESGSQKILDAMDKGITVEQIYEAARKLHEHGVKVAFFLQFGYPSETREDIELTLKMVRDLMPDDIGISVSYPLPGTPFYHRVRDQLSQQANWYDSADLAMLYHGPFVTEFYRQLHTVMHKDYRSRKAWRALRHVAAHPTQFSGQHLRQLAQMLYYQATLPFDRRRLDALARIPHKPTTLPIIPSN
ncbi:radical SAM protein [Aggregatilineales bacterium SYSU G02658]